MKEFTVNGYGVVIRKCCASCLHKGQTRLMTKRHCSEHDKDVKTTGLCSLWQMSDQVKAAGLGGGKIKRREYLKYLTRIREVEDIAKQNGLSIVSMTIDEVRSEFEQEHCSIFINI